MNADHIKLLAAGVPVKLNGNARPHYLEGARAMVARMSLRTGGVTIDLLVERAPYRIGDEIQVQPYELDLEPHWIVMCEVSGGVTGLRQGPLRDAGRVLTFPRQVDADAFAAGLLAKVSPHAKATFRYWAVGRP